jgi:hypothetical protein
LRKGKKTQDAFEVSGCWVGGGGGVGGGVCVWGCEDEKLLAEYSL